MLSFFNKIFRNKTTIFQDYYNFFKHSELNRILATEGYLKTGILNKDAIKKIQNKIEFETPMYEMAESTGYIEGVCIEDKKIRRDLDEMLRFIISPFLDKIMHNYKSILYTAIVKDSDKNSNIDLHQDWSLTDERKFPSLTLWMPLVDSSEENGTIYLVPKSHKKYNNIRGGTIPFVFSEKEKDNLLKQMIPIKVNAGEVVLFNQRIVHYSPPNLSSAKRVSVLASLLPNVADTIQYFKREDEIVEMYKMNDDFFLDFNDFLLEKDFKPIGEKIKELNL